MPARVARSSLAVAAPKTARNKNKKRSLDAYAAASKQVPERRIPQHRLGEDIDDEPRSKKRRTVEADEGDSEDDGPQSRSAHRAQNDDPNIEYASDSSGNEWTTGGLAEDAEDSEIDSDEAFGESDEERFRGFTFRGSSSGKKSKGGSQSKKPLRPAKDLDLDESEDDAGSDSEGDSADDEGRGFGDDAVDLAAMLDDEDEDMLGAHDTTQKDMGEESDDEDDSADGDDGFSSSSQSEDDDEDAADEERVARLRDRLEALDKGGAKAPVAAPTDTTAATVDDFLADTDLALTMAKPKSKKKATELGPVAAPLPKRQQDRLDREAAAVKAKEQLDRWRDTVVRNRRAEFLNFPLQDSAQQSAATGKTKFAQLNDQAPRSELEESIQRIMEESGLASKFRADEDGVGDEEAALLKSEELATNKLPVEEVMRRRRELRQARELLFREEIKAKRIAKIKSKSYRRVHRRERERIAEQERQAMQGLEGADAMGEDERERADRKRAEARMSTKHRDSKWAKSLKATNRATWDDDARDGVIEQARRNEELKRRIAGIEVRDDDDDDASLHTDDDSDYGGADSDDATTLQKLSGVKESQGEAGKGLANLKFMRAAEDRRKKANDEDIERLRKEMALADGEEEEEIDDDGLGRAIFGPRAQKEVARHKAADRLEFEAPDASDDEDNRESRDSHEAATSDERTASKPAQRPVGRAKASGPLAKASENLAQHHTAGDSSGKSKGNSWLKAPKGKSGNDATQDIQLDLSTSQSTDLASTDSAPSAAGKQASKSASKPRKAAQVQPVPDPESDSDVDESSDPLLATQMSKALQQRAFAGDNVTLAFETEKADLAASEDEKEVSTHLPGWGSWTGTGLSKAVRKANNRAKHNPLFKSKTGGVKLADRKDAKLPNVIVSEKQDRKGKKYLAPVLPHEYQTKDQYERSRRMPMGPEWTTKESHQRVTRPRVVVKPGVMLGALERPMV